MTLKFVVLSVFAVLGQSFAAPYRKSISAPNCGCGSNRVSVSVTEDDSYPVYNYKGIGVSEDDSVPVYNYKGIGVSEEQPRYKPISSSSVAVPENGGAFTVTSVGAIAPAGIAVATDLGLVGELAISGEVPYLSAVAFEGQFASNGAAAVAYGCGDGNIAITETIGNAGPGYGISSLSGCGCGKY